ncbi:hypothetical protein [Streptomyces albipurpureus]|uniref:Uncharacterized protein n=1 Tax=Streptomyces albipurpureus TaxID=2897419 RepID=A0ABT0UJJ3_9ACTN|nr:hypothetical protein [Streptomyces sp. CWNU-1]MCM2388797.1 hypothetical protein [Streptomyces sp. CWNU-1]
MPIHRTRSTRVRLDLAHFGFKAMAAESNCDTGLLDMLDALLVQARRQARVIAWHAADDDLHVLRGLARSCGGHRHPGITGLSEAWAERDRPASGLARCVDTALDFCPGVVIADAAVEHALAVADELLGLQHPTHMQLCHDVLAEGGDTTVVTETIAAAALLQAVMTALLGGKATDRLHWEGDDVGNDRPLDLHRLIDTVAWGQFPTLFSRTLHW